LTEQWSRRKFLALATGLSAAAAGACTTAPAASPPAAGGAPPAAPKPANTAAPAAAATAAPAASQARGQVKLAFIRGIFDLAYILGAQDAGIYDQHAIDLEIVPFQDDPTATRALISGEVLVYEVAPARPLSAIDQGSALKIVGVSYARLPFVMLARQGINSMRDLQGKTLGVGAPGDLNQQLQMALLRQQGLENIDVTWAAIGPTPQIMQALIAGRIDAGTGLFSNEIQLRGNPDIHTLADVSQELPNLVRFALVVRQDSIERQDDLLRRFFVAHSAAWRWALEHRDEVIQAAVKHVGMEAPIAAGAYDAALTRPGMITPEFTVTPEQMAAVQAMNVAAGQQTRTFSFEQVTDLRYVQAVAQALGPYTAPMRQLTS
jgi:NitT/TauT family transport system substrate-binding protein